MTGCKLSSLNNVVAVCGVQNGIDQADMSYSNIITNISDVKYRYRRTGVDRYLQIMFKLDDITHGGFIEDGILRAAIVNVHDIRFFEWYHYLNPGASFEDAMDAMNRLSEAGFAEALRSIDLAEFQKLEDVQDANGIKVLASGRRLQFKIDEEDYF